MFFDTGLPKVECDKKATFGSKPNNLATLTHDIETLANLSAEGKSADIAEKILSGKLKKFYQENTLLNQKFVMDPDSSIQQVLENNKQILINFVRFKVGEGIDKKESDFAAEVKDIVS